ncbi:PA2169 family four-helix-bundle protein [uncultured Kriegella sp.]|uniref:ferritin-like domain-containing protein n=1 Tax=uncultured Kriegella sp. TaxID=1798910 RepID=UPI0030D83AB9|tara:strand:- start:73906 stop:74355 length:450 start_codon:yes stop_codon:yes gene_type:complete
MTTYTEKVGNKLNDLLQKTYDAEKGYKKAADNVKNIPLKNYFERKAQERYDFGHALKKEIKEFGTEVEKGDSFTSKAHRSWMDVKALFSTDNEEAMLKEAINGEKAALEEYQDVLSETALPPTTANLLISQKNHINSGLNTIKGIEDLK